MCLSSSDTPALPPASVRARVRGCWMAPGRRSESQSRGWVVFVAEDDGRGIRRGGSSAGIRDVMVKRIIHAHQKRLEDLLHFKHQGDQISLMPLVTMNSKKQVHA
mmetsp:Transcript_18522/g.21311  ORF Transcript_18522/g.21311 Transcript_18522/m.21311 type:complete len:105 (-) Transcript_18522:200-514(-)